MTSWLVVGRAASEGARRRERRVLLRCAACLGGAWIGACDAPIAAAQQDEAFEAYLAEMNDPNPGYVAVSNHFRHEGEAPCGPDGCVLLGPTDDLEACERWSEAYNLVDPYDYTRCIAAPVDL